MEHEKYAPIGRVYAVSFMDSNGFYWNSNVIIPADCDVTSVLRILSEAFPGQRVKELKELCIVYHGEVGKQNYGR